MAVQGQNGNVHLKLVTHLLPKGKTCIGTDLFKMAK